MRHLFLPIIFILLVFPLASRDTINADIVKAHTHHFSIVDGEFTGSGATWFTDQLAPMHFVLIGEYHGSRQIACLTDALIQFLGPKGFDQLVLEIGPITAELLRQYSDGETAVAKVRELHQEYVNKITDVPFPFLEGEEDLIFLKSAFDECMSIRGVDQEYYGSTLMLIDILQKEFGNKDNEQLYLAATQNIAELYLTDFHMKDFPLFSKLLKNDAVEKYFNSLPQNQRAKQVVKEIKDTWNIYHLYETDRNRNLEWRAEKMRTNFSQAYKEAQKTNDNPKMLIKMGGYHIMRGLTYNAVYDIGNLVDMLADFNGQQDFNMGFMTRFGEDDEEEMGYYDNAEGNSDWLTAHRPFLLQGKKEEWTVIDLRPLKADMVNRKIWVYPSSKNRIYDHDVIVIPPLDGDVELIYTEYKK